MEDDHYIANRRNAHIDTTSFEEKIRGWTRVDPPIQVDALVERIYNLAFRTTAIAPIEPTEDAFICRYFAPQRFIQFISSRKLPFPTATQFSDRWECAVPEDYDNAVLKVLAEEGRSGSPWASFVRAKANTWNVSCWTELEDYFDDHLMWEVYGGGENGVGVTIRYGNLKRHLEEAVGTLDLDGQLQSGRVNYQSISLLPFNKHFMFRNEKEIRFAFRSYDASLALVSVDEIFDSFGIRISPAAEVQHRDMIRQLWLNYGGEDRINHPQ